MAGVIRAAQCFAQQALKGGSLARYIDFAVAGKVVTATTDGSLTVGGTREHYMARATFDEEWDGLEVRVTWTNGATSVTQRWVDGMEVPPECAVPGRLRASWVGIGPDGIETLRTARMAEPVAFAACGDDLGDDAREQTEDVVHEAKRRLDDLSQAVDEAQGTVADAREAAALAKGAAEKADGAASKASTAAGRAEGAATSAEGAARKAQTAAGRADASADGADEAAAKAADTVARVDGELTLMLGNPTDEDMWLYATGQAEAASNSPVWSDVTDEDMMAYVKREA